MPYDVVRKHVPHQGFLTVLVTVPKPEVFYFGPPVTKSKMPAGPMARKVIAPQIPCILPNVHHVIRPLRQGMPRSKPFSLS